MAFNSQIGGNADLRYDLFTFIDGRKTPSSAFQLHADTIAPPVMVSRTDGHIPYVQEGDGEREIEGERGEDGSYPLIIWKLGDVSFFVKNRGWEMAIDNFEDVENNEIINLEEYHAIQLEKTMVTGNEVRVADAAQDVTLHGAQASDENATPWDTGTNARDALAGDGAAMTILYESHGLELEQMSMVIGINAIRQFIYIDDVREQLKFTDPIDKMNLQRRIGLLAEYFGVLRIVPVSGRINNAKWKTKKGPKFSRIWKQDICNLCYLSEGGPWDTAFMRSPWWGGGTQGKEFMFESYDLPQNDQTRTRIKHSRGLVTDYSYSFIFEKIFG